MSQMQWDKPATGGTGRVLAVEDDAAQMPLNMLAGGGTTQSPATLGAEGEDFSWVDAKPKKRNSASGLLLVLIVVAIGGASLYGMRLAGGTETRDTGAEDAAKKIDSVLEKLAKSAGAHVKPGTKGALADSDKIISLFAADPTKQQIQLDQLQKNPFELFVSRDTTDSAAPVAVETVDRVKEEKLHKIKLQLQTLKLQSLMSGSPPLAVISGKIVREGEAIGLFIVDAITPQGVRVTAEGNTYTLAMSKPAMNAQGPKPR